MNNDLRSTLGLEDINQVVHGSIAADRNIRRVDSVFAHDSLDFVVIDMCQGHRACNIQATLVLLLERDVWRLLVYSDPEPLQLGLDDTLVCERLVDIKNDEDEVACFGHSNDLSPSTAAVFGTLNDTRQIDDLQRCALTR